MENVRPEPKATEMEKEYGWAYFSISIRRGPTREEAREYADDLMKIASEIYKEYKLAN